MFFPDAFVAEIKERTDIIDLIGEYTELRKAGDHVWKGKCPFPDRHERGDKDPSMTVYENGSFYCWGCGAGSKDGDSIGSDCFSFIRMKEDLSFNDAVVRLAARLGLEVPKGHMTKEMREQKKFLDLTLSQNRTYYSQLQKDTIAREYLASRGVTDEDILKWRLGVVPPDCKHPPIINRIAFPIFDERGHAVGFGFRSIHGEEPKYLNSPDSAIFSKGNLLYGLNYAKRSILEQRKVYVAEGYMDVIAAHRAGVENCVAIMGTSFTEAQAKLLRRYTDELIFALDGDAAGQHGTVKHIATAKQVGFIVKVAKLEAGLDLDNYAKLMGQGLGDWLEENEVMPSQWQLDVIFSRYRTQLHTLMERTVHECEKVLDVMQENVTPMENTLILHRIGQEFGIPTLKVVHWWMNRSQEDNVNQVLTEME